jgi:hypothetical protein
MLVSCFAYSSILNIKDETSADFYRTTRHYIPENRNPQIMKLSDKVLKVYGSFPPSPLHLSAVWVSYVDASTFSHHPFSMLRQHLCDFSRGIEKTPAIKVYLWNQTRIFRMQSRRYLMLIWLKLYSLYVFLGLHGALWEISRILVRLKWNERHTEEKQGVRWQQ